MDIIFKYCYVEYCQNIPLNQLYIFIEDLAQINGFSEKFTHFLMSYGKIIKNTDKIYSFRIGEWKPKYKCNYYGFPHETMSFISLATDKAEKINMNRKAISYTVGERSYIYSFCNECFPKAKLAVESIFSTIGECNWKKKIYLYLLFFQLENKLLKDILFYIGLFYFSLVIPNQKDHFIWDENHPPFYIPLKNRKV